ncbi:glycoside hydrolase family 3 N-terminal domain-containing protein [Fretibacter rubidus]|uniref:glycoside hydrolase family 3 N-terminal domain-containing protein n=1 Tax=Fretibacter rubidus TaxID=570162 RepID=UPI00352B56DE
MAFKAIGQFSFCAIFLMAFGGCDNPQTENISTPVVPSAAKLTGFAVPRNEAVETQISTLISKMSLEEKAAQMRIFHARRGIELDDNDELVLSDDVKTRLNFGIAGIKNPGEYLTPEKSALLNNKLQKYIIENNRHGIPAVFVTEAYNGVDATGTTRFGRPINMAATFNPALVKNVWDTIGREARLRGLHMCHSPEADIMRDPRFGRMSEAYSEDTHLTTEMVVAAVRGVQGDTKGLSEKTHIGAVTKHFAGYGQVEGGLNFASIQISPRTLVDEIFPPFKAAVQRGQTMGIMPSHGDLNGVASHGNRKLLTDILRDEWGFDGYTVSDSNDIARLNTFMGVAETEDDAALMGLNAGNDIDLYSDIAYSRLPRLAKDNPNIEAQMDEAVRRVLRVKFNLGLFDDPYIDVATVAPKVRNTKSLALAYEADLDSVILLKNRNNTLPLEVSGKTVALIGPLLRETAHKDYQEVFGTKVNIISERALHLTDEHSHKPNMKPLDDPKNKAGFARALDAARRSDVIVMFLGGDEHTAKEAFFNCCYGDRYSLEPVGLQDELLRQVKALGKPVIVVLKHRRTLAINEIAESADAVIDAWDLSEQGDKAVANIIMGKVNPSGKLPVTVPRHIGQIPFHYSQKHINFRKDYLFIEEGALYPFGFGLSYTDFDFSEITLSANHIPNGASLTATVRVTNSGDRMGKEVVQLYIKDLIGSVVRPEKELKAFKKIELAAGESRDVEFNITPAMLAFTDINMDYRVEDGDFKVEIGNSSQGGKLAKFTVETLK